jgi:SIR2-like domain
MTTRGAHRRPAISSVKVDDLPNGDLRDLVLDGTPCLFFGSAVSMWDPTALPSGQQFSRAVCNLLFCSPGHTIPEDLVPSADAFASVPFEVVGEACPQADALKSLIRTLYTGSPPNAIHLAMAQAVGNGVIRSMVTPNYDCSLEKAATRLGVLLSRITREGDEANTRWPQYFKIHGSTDDPENSRLIAFMRDEVRLPGWKEGVLRRLVSGRPLIVVGYSGLDFELGPALDTRPTRVVWLSDPARSLPTASECSTPFTGRR